MPMISIPANASLKDFYTKEGADLGVSEAAVARQVLRQHAINELERRGKKKEADALRKSKGVK